MEEKVTSLEGPVEMIDGKLTLLIPLDAGGSELIACSKGISKIEGEFLKVIIPDWLAEKIKVKEDSLVTVDNRNGKFNITVN